MADLNKFIRSKDKLTEVLRNLMHISIEDERTAMYISHLQQSIKIIDDKMNECQKKQLN
jgi:hypothetical protein